MNLEGLRDYQREPAGVLLDAVRRHGFGVDASDMGIGKTYISCSLVRELDLPTLVVCPKILCSTWENVARSMGTEVSTINWEMVRRGNTPYGKWVRSDNRRGGVWWQWAPEIKFLIFDEAHQANGLETKNAALLFFAKRQRIPSLYLSATPAESLMEFRALGFMLGLHQGEDFYTWLRGKGYGLHNGKFQYRFGRERELELMGKVNRYIFPDRGIRLKADDIPGFPETQISVLGVDIDDAASSKVNSLVESALKELDEHAQSYRQCDTSERIKMAQACELCKVPAMVQLAKDALAQGYSVPIFVNYNRTIDLLKKALPCQVGIIRGVSSKQEHDEREEVIQMFADDELRVLLVISDAGGVGIDLKDFLGRFARKTIISPGDKAKIFRQVVGRVRRNGAKSKSYQIVVTANGIAVDEARKRNLEAKLCRMDALSDGLESLRDEDLDLVAIAEELKKKVPMNAAHCHI